MAKAWKNIILEQTCCACPEQYDAYIGTRSIGYLRLRHGYFRAEYNDVVVYETSTIGDGCFDSKERTKHLNNARKAIYKAMIADENNSPAINALYHEELSKISELSQNQSSLKDQLAILRPFANRLGLYDAADFIKK